MMFLLFFLVDELPLLVCFVSPWTCVFREIPWETKEANVVKKKKLNPMKEGEHCKNNFGNIKFKMKSEEKKQKFQSKVLPKLALRSHREHIVVKKKVVKLFCGVV